MMNTWFKCGKIPQNAEGFAGMYFLSAKHFSDLFLLSFAFIFRHHLLSHSLPLALLVLGFSPPLTGILSPGILSATLCPRPQC